MGYRRSGQDFTAIVNCYGGRNNCSECILLLDTNRQLGDKRTSRRHGPLRKENEMTIQIRYERRMDCYEWLAMSGQRIIESGYAGNFAAAERLGAEWVAYAKEVENL
jgi:hypothetical protein